MQNKKGQIKQADTLFCFCIILKKTDLMIYAQPEKQSLPILEGSEV